MSERVSTFTEHFLDAAQSALWALGSVAIVLFALALIVKGRTVFAEMRAALPETRTNISLYAVDLLIVTPLLILPGLVLIERAMNGAGLQFVDTSEWEALPAAATGFAVLFLGDMIGYFRHRIEHSRVLWPAHAVHHSDTRMTWLTLMRLHPVNRVTTACFDAAVLALLGFPAWALVFLALVRHFYGAFIHMNLDWTFGPLGRLFVSPAMHRWHHVLDGPGVGKNFATIFSVFDQVWGTYYVPGACRDRLGVPEDMGHGALGQLWHPFKVWLRGLGLLRDPERAHVTPGE